MADVTQKEREDHQKVVDGLSVQIDRLDHQESELFNKIMTIKDQKKALEKQKEEEKTSFELKVHQTQLQVTQAMQMAQAIQRAELMQRAEVMQQAASAHQPAEAKVIIDLTDEPAPQPAAGVKRERSPSHVAEELAVPNNGNQPQHQQPHQARPVANAAQPRIKRERRSLNPRPNHRTGAYAIIADTHPTVITLPHTDGAVELRCDLCGGNAHPHGERWNKGLPGFHGHFQMCHRSQLANDEYYSQDSVIQRCTVHRLSQEEVDAVQAGDPDAYVVKMVPGAGRDHAAGLGHRGERGPGIKPAAFGPNPYGRSAGEETAMQADGNDGMEIDSVAAR